jgi:hypothetical protein
MKYKTIMRKLRENGWNMKFDARENALIEDIAKITEKHYKERMRAGFPYNIFAVKLLRKYF